MKNSILTTIILIAICSSFSFGQSDALLASNDIESISFDKKSEIRVEMSNANTPKIYTIPQAAVNFDMNPETNVIDIDINNNVNYTKAELLSKDTNQTVQSLNMSAENQSVDVSTVNAGTYYLILSNEEGKVFSEKIIIL